MLRQRARPDFVAAVLAGVTAAPAYQSRLRRMNRDGPPLMGLVSGYRGPAAISPGSAAAALRARGIMIDLREPLAFDEGHARGAINLQPGPDLGCLAAGLLPPDPRVVLLASDGRQAAQAARQLLRVGVSRIDGYVNGGFAAWTAAGLPVSVGTSAVPSAPSVLSV
jgi:hydroxyacylglutathione hydrolase